MAKKLPVAPKTDKIGKDQDLSEYWLKQIAASSKHEEKWRRTAEKVWVKYRNEDRSLDINRSAYNILYANVEVLKGVLYQKPPIPEVRRRFRDKDPVGRVAAEVLDRALTFNLDAYDFDATVREVVLDRLVPGRGNAFVKYIPTFAPQDPPDKGDAQAVTSSVKNDPELREAPEVIYEEVRCEYVEWDMFRYSPAKRWSKVKWVAFGEPLDEQDLKKRFPSVWSKVKLNYSDKNSKKDTSSDDPFEDDVSPNKTGRALVWTIWSKVDKKVYFVSPGYKEGLLGVKDDPLRLEQFFPCPRPLYGQWSNTSLVPTPDYVQYQDQAEELNALSTRIINLVRQLKRTGVYDSQFEELRNILQNADGQFTAVQNYASVVDKGGVQNTLYEMPIDGIAKVVQALYAERTQAIQVIYDITGIGDIVRGSTNPNETASAQELKANYANSRIGPAQREVQRWVRDILRLKAEIMAEHFSQQTLQLITGIQLPTAQEKQARQIQIQQAQQQGKPPPPPMEDPTWEEVMELLRNERIRAMRVDIETDSTLALTEPEDKRAIAETFNAMGLALQSLTPAVQGGVLSKDAAGQILIAIARQGGFSYRIEEAIENAPPQPPPDPVEVERQRIQADTQAKLAIGKQEGEQKMALQQQQGQQALQIEQARGEKELQMEKVRQLGKMDLEAAKGTAPGLTTPEGKSLISDMLGQLTQALGHLAQGQQQEMRMLQQLGEAVRMTMQRLAAPKRFIYGPDGQLAGREVVGFGVEPIQRDESGKVIGTGSVQ